MHAAGLRAVVCFLWRKEVILLSLVLLMKDRARNTKKGQLVEGSAARHGGRQDKTSRGQAHYRFWL